MPQLEDVSQLKKLEGLTELNIYSCKKLTNLSFLQDLKPPISKVDLNGSYIPLEQAKQIAKDVPFKIYFDDKPL